jgi:hypothetical protein
MPRRFHERGEVELMPNRTQATNMDEYLDQVNELLKTATPVGAYCLGFTLALYKEIVEFPPPEIMREFVNCKTVQEGEAILQEFRALRNPRHP